MSAVVVATPHMDDLKRCKSCDTVKPRWQFAHVARNKDGVDGACRDCRTRAQQIAAARNRKGFYDDMRSIGAYDAEVVDLAHMYEPDCE